MSQQDVDGLNSRNLNRNGLSYRNQCKVKGDARKKQHNRRRPMTLKDPSDQECSKCGRKHCKTDKCPVKGKKCNKCNKYIDFAQINAIL